MVGFNAGTKRKFMQINKIKARTIKKAQGTRLQHLVEVSRVTGARTSKSERKAHKPEHKAKMLARAVKRGQVIKTKKQAEPAVEEQEEAVEEVKMVEAKKANRVKKTKAKVDAMQE